MSNYQQYPNPAIPRRPVPGARNAGNPAVQQPAPPSTGAATPRPYAPPPSSTITPESGLAPALPPRPPGGAGPFLSRTYINFPPPPRSPNRPPDLPPRPQPTYPQTGYSHTAHGTYIYGQPTHPPAHPQQAPYTFHEPLSSGPMPPGASGAPNQATYQPIYYPPPPPIQPPPPQTHNVDSLYISQNQPPSVDFSGHTTQATTYPPAYDQVPSLQHSSAVLPPDVQNTDAVLKLPDPEAHLAPDRLQNGHANYGHAYDPRNYPTPQYQTVSASVQPPALLEQTVIQYETSDSQNQGLPPADAPAILPNSAGFDLARTSQTGLEQQQDEVQHMNTMLQSMNISDAKEGSTRPGGIGDSHAAEAFQHVPASNTPQSLSGPVELPALSVSAPQQNTTASHTEHCPPQQMQPQPISTQSDAQTQSGHLIPQEQPLESRNYITDNPTSSSTPYPAAYPLENSPPIPVTNCIDNLVTFATTWYTHASAPEAFICSKCYVDYLWPTPFRDQFDGKFLMDGLPRRCRFKVPRITDQLLHDATTRGTLETLLEYMNHRVQIADCKGQGGAKGTEGVKWFRPKQDAIPGMVVCEACFEDIACITPFAYSFEPALGHEANQVWSCDLSIPFIRKEFDERSKTGDWATFAKEAKARMGIPACPKGAPVMISLRKWFTPVNGPPDAVLCAACYCDRILKSGQESLWESKPRDLIHSKAVTNTCCLGQFHILMAIGAAGDNNDWPPFWKALNKIAYEEKVCDANGIKDGRWFTLPSQPAGFSVCGACYAGIVETLDLTPFFVPKRDVPPPDVPILCSMNNKSPRFAAYVDKMLETWFTRDCTSWETYAAKYGLILKCPRDEDFKNRLWYGWMECVICPECYVEFVSGTALDTEAAMPLRGVQLGESRMCEMYSPRMRNLYIEACSRTPPDPADLLAYAVERRLIYVQTMPICRNMLMQEKFLANQIGMARLQSVAYTGMGGIESASSAHKPTHTYGQAGVGYGFENQNALAGARYNVQANQLSAQLGGNKILIVGQLERQWRAVE